MAFDLLMVATVFQNQPQVEKMQELLALDYPQSLQARYFRSTFANASDYRQLLSGLIDEFSREQSPTFPEHFTQGMGAAMDDFGDQLLDDPDFLLKSVYLLEAAGEVREKKDLLARLKPMLDQLDQDDDLAQIAALAADSQQSKSKKAIALHDFSHNQAAQFLRDLLLFQMTEDEREEPAIRQISAEASIQDKKFADALALLERQPLSEDGDKIIFQRAWSHAALGQPDNARELLAQLEAGYPDSPWLAPARELQEAMEQYDSRLEVFTDALIGAAGALAELEALEGTLLYTRAPTNTPITAYVAMDIGGNSFETQLRRSEELELAYRTAPEGAILYTKGEKVLRRTSEPGPVPSFKVDLQPSPEGGFSFSLSANLVNDVDDLVRNNRSLLESPFLTTREGAAELLNYLQQSGFLLGKVGQRDGQTTLKLLLPDARDPEAMTSEIFHINATGQLVGLAIGDIEVRNMHYGESESMTFSPPEWPPLDTVMTKEFSAGLFFSIIENMAQLFMAPSEN
ncbi:tetratricopeptide repeat protein [Thiorhodovibrio frisius]|uniref:tetratricopeptide repeat protein n=1 Tax=Thiorhodovibrio frisius TaxID=631362 RepID=UPI001CBCFA99|nr:hypothetical protein [Thiorhodovibrio frisius]